MRPIRLALASILAILIIFALHRAPAEEPSGSSAGATLYQQRCALCHESRQSRAPARAALANMSPDAIRYALAKGVIQAQGVGLTAAQVDELIAFLVPASSLPLQSAAGAGFCTTKAPFENLVGAPHWSGWGNGSQQQRFQSAFAAGIDAQTVADLQLKWAFAFPGANQAASQPAVAGGRVFVGSANGNVYALDARTGCSYWTFHAGAGVRTALSIGPVRTRWAIFFGDQAANAYAIDASNGGLLWKAHLDPHPAAMVTGAPVLYGGVLYVPLSSYEEVAGASAAYPCCTFRGSVSALDATTGKLIWKASTISDPLHPVRKNKSGTQLWGPSGAAVWSSPTIDAQRHALYVTTGDSYSEPAASTSDAFVAFDLKTGKRLWYRQVTANDVYTSDCGFPVAMRTNCPANPGHDFDFGSSPMLVRLSDGRRALIAGQKSGIVYAIDPDRRGAVLWQRRVGQGGPLGGVQWGSATDGRNVYVAVSDVELRLAGAGTAGAQASIFGAPMLLSPSAGGGLFALDLTTGNIVWRTAHPPCVKPGCSPAQSAAVTAIPRVVFSGGLDGHLRAYSADDGRIIWDVDTERSYQTVDGVVGRGGSLDGPGAVVVSGMLYANSGYAYLGSAPGNVLLAFSVDGR
jgi:polyvinyl alcohol dehydrogenase (cytochrome)